MKKIILASTVLAAMALSSCSLTINGKEVINDDFNYKKTRTETMNIAPEKASKLDIDLDVGKVEIKYGDTKNVDIDIKYTSNGTSEEKVDAVLESADVMVKVKGDTVSIESSEKDFDNRFVSLTTDLEITLPSEFSDFVIDSDVGDIRLDKLKGSFDITADVGNVQLDSLVGEFKIVAGVGNIDCDYLTVKKDSDIKANVGNIDVSLEGVSECEVNISADVGDVDLDTQGLVFTEVTQSKDFAGKKQEIVIDDKCTVTLKADVGSVKATK